MAPAPVYDIHDPFADIISHICGASGASAYKAIMAGLPSPISSTANTEMQKVLDGSLCHS